ncbi:MAG: hypothetical protein AAGM40_06055 [Cyanobacteria bacterium J06573_2]
MLLKTLVQRKSLFPPSPLGFQMKPLNNLSPLGRFETPLGQNFDADDFTFPFVRDLETNINSVTSNQDVDTLLKSHKSTNDIQAKENSDIPQNYKNPNSENIPLSNITVSEHDTPLSIQQQESIPEFHTFPLPEKPLNKSVSPQENIDSITNTNLQTSDYFENQLENKSFLNNQSVNNQEFINENSQSNFVTQVHDERKIAPNGNDEPTTQQLSEKTNLPEPLKSLKPLAQTSDFYISKFVGDYLSNKPGIYSSTLLQNENQADDNQIPEKSPYSEIEATQTVNQLQTNLETDYIEKNYQPDSLRIENATQELAQENQVNSQLKPNSDTLLNPPNEKSSIRVETNSEEDNQEITLANPNIIQKKLKSSNHKNLSNPFQLDASSEESSSNNSISEQSYNIQPQILPSNHQEATRKTDIDSSPDAISEQNTQLTEKETLNKKLSPENIASPQELINQKPSDITTQQQKIPQQSNIVEQKPISSQLATPKINFDSNISPEIVNREVEDTTQISTVNYSEESIQLKEQGVSQIAQIQQKSESQTSEISSQQLLDSKLNNQYSQIKENTQKSLSSQTIQANLQKSNSPEKTQIDENIDLPTSIKQTQLQKTQNVQTDSNHLSAKSNYSHLPPLSKISPLVKASDLQLTRFVNESANLANRNSDNEELYEENHLSSQQAAENQSNEKSINTNRKIDLSLKTENIENNQITTSNDDIPDSWSDISELLSNTSPANSDINSQSHNLSTTTNQAGNLNENLSNDPDVNQYIDSSNKKDLQINRQEINNTSNQDIINSWSNISELIGESFATPSTIPQSTSDEFISPPSNQNNKEIISSEKPTTQSQKPTDTKSNEINDEDLEILAYQIYRVIRQKLEIDRECQGRNLFGYPEWLNIIPLNLSIGNYEKINQVDFIDENTNLLAQEIYKLISIRLQIEQERYSHSYAFAHR